MHNDLKLFKWAIVMLMLPLTLAFCGKDNFRYPCQDPANWEKDFCKPPVCDVTRTCPEHIFKGQRDPRLGPPPAPGTVVAPQCTQPTQGANCGK
jgi:hypothetical protein